MKKRDLIYLSIAIALLVVTVLLLINNARGGDNTGPTVEVIEPINSDYKPAILADIADSQKHRNFAVDVDLNTELGNPKPFGH